MLIFDTLHATLFILPEEVSIVAGYLTGDSGEEAIFSNTKQNLLFSGC